MGTMNGSAADGPGEPDGPAGPTGRPRALARYSPRQQGWATLLRSWGRYATLNRARERLRHSYVLVPLLGLLCGGVLALLSVSLDETLSAAPETAHDPDFRAFGEPSRNVIDAVGPQMLTFIGVVFSLTLVALQVAAGQLSPRVVNMFTRSRITKGTLAVFLGTFFFTLIVQYLSLREGAADPSEEEFVPFASGIVTMLLVTLSVVMFVCYVHRTMRLFRLTEVIDRIAHETLRTLRRVGATVDGADADAAGPLDRSGVVRVVTHQGRPGVLRGVRTDVLVRKARRYDAVIELVPGVGDFIAPGAPLYRVHGGRAEAVPARAVRRAVVTGAERTMYEDLAFGFRQLVDVAGRALSAHSPDPTTVVQVLDRLQVLLAACACARLDRAVHRDLRGGIRLVEPLPTWEGLVRLSFEEILQSGAGSAQVTRRMAAALGDLEAQVPPARAGILRHYRSRLLAATARTHPDAVLRTVARAPDRQGLGA